MKTLVSKKLQAAANTVPLACNKLREENDRQL